MSFTCDKLRFPHDAAHLTENQILPMSNQRQNSPTEQIPSDF